MLVAVYGDLNSSMAASLNCGCMINQRFLGIREVAKRTTTL